MSNRSNYNTKQKEILLEYIKTLDGKHVSVNEIKDYINTKGLKVGLTTIYRQLENLINEGQVAKINLDSSSSAVFEYIGDKHLDHEDCYHLKCEACNKIVHFHCPELEHIKKHMENDHGFTINSAKTIFYGMCNQCNHK